MDVTTNGAVPVAMLLINWGAVTLALARTCAVPKLPTLALPDTPNVPVTFAPVDVAVILAVPETAVVTLPVAPAIVILLVPPFARTPIKLPAVKLPDTPNVPVTFAPVAATVIVGLPAMTIFRLPLVVLMLA